MKAELGRLQRVDLRDVWLSESAQFTPWLASSENLELLAGAVGLELELEAQERNVGPFRADILCKDVETGHWVLIENQLERTDHNHLGQLLTYASGLQAVTIIWIAARFTEQHRATLDWLNEITDERFKFFGLEVELWRIGESLAAPKFNIVSKPNDWTRDVGVAAKRIEAEALTDTRQRQLAFWTLFRDRLQAAGSSARAQKPYPQHWMNFSIGRSGYWLSATLNSAEQRCGVELNMNTSPDKANFYALRSQQSEIEALYGHELTWMELPGKKSSRVALFRNGLAPLDEENWPDMAEWMQKHLERFQTVFRPRIRALASVGAEPVADPAYGTDEMSG